METNNNLTELLASIGFLFPRNEAEMDSFNTLYERGGAPTRIQMMIDPEKIISQARANESDDTSADTHKKAVSDKAVSVNRTWKHRSVIELIAGNVGMSPEDIIRLKARNCVKEALSKGWDGPPYNSIELARILGIKVSPNDKDVPDARTVPLSKNTFLIEYNPFQRPTRINFSVAHEIVHTMFPDCAAAIRNREESPTENRELERLCNIGASELQLPHDVFTEDVESLGNITLEKLTQLANKYKVSLESLFIRVAEITSDDCTLSVCSFQNRDRLIVEYTSSSPTCPIEMPPQFCIPSESIAYECVAPGVSRRETTKWPCFDKGYNVYYIGLSPLPRDNRGRVGMIIVPNRDGKLLQDREIDIEFGDATMPSGSGVKIIAQVVNTYGALGSGFGKSLASKYPEVKEALVSWKTGSPRFLLGTSQLVRVGIDLYVYQMLAQNGIKRSNNPLPLDYDSLSNCLQELKRTAVNLGASVHMPFIGAGQAGGDWEVIKQMIHRDLVKEGITVKVYARQDKKLASSKSSSLTLFKG